MELAGGLELRNATPADIEGVVALLAARGEPADGIDLQLIVTDPEEGLDACGVVVDGARVVSTATLLAETVRFEDVEVPAGQVELVATDPEYEGRGLVRALMAWAHRRSAARGDLLQVMIGIPFFYRQFGYAYAAPIPRIRELAVIPQAPTDGTVVRRAMTRDIPAMASLQDAVQRSADVTMPHSAACWRWLTERHGSTQWVVERAGDAVATARTTPPDEGLVLAEIASHDPAAVAALVAHARALGDGDVSVQERRGTVVQAALDPLLEAVDPHDSAQDEWYYARIERLGPLLRRIGPVLGRRLEAAGFTGTHDVLLSSWRSHVRFTVDASGVGALSEGGPEQRPISKGGAGIPPDVLPPLLLGPDGATGLEARHADCMLGRRRDLMGALFPPVRADLLTFYLPV